MSKSLKRTNMMYVNQPSYMEKNGVPTDLNELAEYIKRKIAPKEFAIILHDRDLKDGKPVEPHIHIALRFKRQRYLHVIAKAFNDENVANVAKWDRNYKNMYLYLVHLTDNSEDNKAPYKNSEVVASFDFDKFIEETVAEVFKPRKEIITDLLNDYGYGNISLEDIKEELTPLEFSKNKKHIDTIKKDLLIAADFEFFKEEMKESKRKIKTYFCFGETGTGKTSWAKNFAHEKNMSYYITGSNRDLFSNYENEQIIIADDLRPETLPYEEILKLTDPYNFEVSAGSRYYDKRLVAEIIIITTPYSPNDFYFASKSSENTYIVETELNRVKDVETMNPDSPEQLFRRINPMEFTKNSIIPHFWDNDEKKFKLLNEYAQENKWSKHNPFPSKNELIEDFSKLFGDDNNVV